MVPRKWRQLCHCQWRCMHGQVQFHGERHRVYRQPGTKDRKEVGRRVIKEEVKKEQEEEEPTLPPFTSLMRRGTRTPPPRPPPPRFGASTLAGSTSLLPRPCPPRWVSPVPQRAESPPPPYQGIIVSEVPQRPQSPPPPYGEVKKEQNAIGVRGNCCICLSVYFFNFYF